MKKNIGTIDRVIRVIIGVFILSLFFWGPKSPWALLGLLPLATAMCGYCPPYAILGISTCKKNT
jgi:hypothetical protein